MAYKLLWWSVALASACARPATAPNDSPSPGDAPLARQANGGREPPSSEILTPSSTGELPPPVEQVLALRLTRERFGELPSLWKQHDWRSAIVVPSSDAPVNDPAQRVDVRLPAPNPEARAWLQLDDRMPRLVDQVHTLSDLTTEWEPLQAGEHWLTLFATGQDGRVLVNSDADPVLDRVGLVIGEKASLAVPPTVVLMSPHGTLNGEHAAGAARFQFWDEGGNAPHPVVIRGPEGAVLRQSLQAGAYALSGLVSGDYSFVVEGPAGATSQLTVNLELEPGGHP